MTACKFLILNKSDRSGTLHPARPQVNVNYYGEIIKAIHDAAALSHMAMMKQDNLPGF